jgi:hypothetical protein
MKAAAPRAQIAPIAKDTHLHVTDRGRRGVRSSLLLIGFAMNGATRREAISAAFPNQMSGQCAGFFRPLPKPLGHAASCALCGPQHAGTVETLPVVRFGSQQVTSSELDTRVERSLTSHSGKVSIRSSDGQTHVNCTDREARCESPRLHSV